MKRFVEKYLHYPSKPVCRFHGAGPLSKLRNIILAGCQHVILFWTKEHPHMMSGIFPAFDIRYSKAFLDYLGSYPP